MLKLDGRTAEQLYEALFSAFPDRNSLERMVRFELNQNLEQIAGAILYADVLFRLIQWAERQGKTGDLVAAALRDNPGNPQLQSFEAVAAGRKAPAVEGTLAAPPGTTRGDRRGELVEPEAVARWAQRMDQARHAVCRVEQQYGAATGFLIAPRLVLTARHVMTEPIKHAHTRSVLDTVRFGFTPSDDAPVSKAMGDRDFLELSDADGPLPLLGTEHFLAETWLVDHDEALDYALLLLDGAPGRDRIDHKPRGWLKPSSGHDLQPGDPLFILQYAFGRSLRVGYAEFRRADAETGRLYYNRDGISTPGASGAPVCNANWDVVGIHRANVPRRNDAGQILAVDGSVWQSDQPRETIDWAASEGVWLAPLLNQPQVQLALALSEEKPQRPRGAQMAA